MATTSGTTMVPAPLPPFPQVAKTKVRLTLTQGYRPPKAQSPKQASLEKGRFATVTLVIWTGQVLVTIRLFSARALFILENRNGAQTRRRRLAGMSSPPSTLQTNRLTPFDLPTTLVMEETVFRIGG